MTKKIKAAIIGYGNVGRYAVDAVLAAPDMELAGIVEATGNGNESTRHNLVSTIEELEPTGPVIGLLDEPGYRERQVALRPGDVLVMFTDGVTEAINRNEEMFSDERLRAVVQESHTLTAAEMVETIQRAVGSFCGNAPQFDDMTIMVLKVE
jgi:serine phosphatase RsbU (regulator of sigma subunit)